MVVVCFVFFFFCFFFFCFVSLFHFSFPCSYSSHSSFPAPETLRRATLPALAPLPRTPPPPDGPKFRSFFPFSRHYFHSFFLSWGRFVNLVFLNTQTHTDTHRHTQTHERGKKKAKFWAVRRKGGSGGGGGEREGSWPTLENRLWNFGPPPPFGAFHPLWSKNSTSKNSGRNRIGRSRNWPKSKLAEVEMAEVEIGRSRSRSI